MRHASINPYIPIIIAVFAISTTAIFVKLASGAPTGIIAFYRTAFAAVIMLPFIIFDSKKEFKQMFAQDWFLIIISGLFLAIHFILWFQSLNYTSVSSSVILLSLQPIFLFLATYFLFGDRFSVGAIISIIITFIGSTIIVLGDFSLTPSALLGDTFALLSAISITGFLLIGQKVRRRLSLITYTFLSLASSTVFLFIYNLIVSNSFFGYPPSTWGWLILLALIPTLFGQSLFNWALKWLSATHISMASVFEPICATILAYFVLAEKVTPFQWVGGAVIIFGLFLFIMSTIKRRGFTISQN